MLAGHLKVVDSLYQQQATSFAAKNIPDESLNLTGAGPAANSTEQSFIAADGAAGNTGTGNHGKEDKGYKIKAEAVSAVLGLPFTGDSPLLCPPCGRHHGLSGQPGPDGGQTAGREAGG